MAFRQVNFYLLQNKQNAELFLKRFGHTLRGKPPGVARTLAQRLIDEKIENPLKHLDRINIGFPQIKLSRSDLLKERLNHIKQQKSSPILEKLSRSNELKIDLNEVRSDWLKTNGPFQVKNIAEHYGIYEHLFETGYFLPRVPLDIKYITDKEIEIPVYTGNSIKPSEAQKEPTIQFDYTFKIQDQQTRDNSWWSLILTNPDGHLKENNKEYIHWFVGNIPNGNISDGEKIVPYLQPFPPKGTGYHRHIFILYKQEEKIDFSEYKVNDLYNLESRTFRTFDFYVKHQNSLTPAGLAFFQSDWEKDLTDFFHKKLNIKEPVYEYDFPKPYIKEQKWFPIKEPFNLYMDKYRDPKKVAKEYLQRKLAKTHPFDGPEKPLKYPNAHPIKNVPSWLKTEMKKDRLKWGRINDF